MAYINFSGGSFGGGGMLIPNSSTTTPQYRNQHGDMFSLGDMVIARSEANNHCSITREGWIGRLVSIDSRNQFDIIGNDGHHMIALDPNYFEPYDSYMKKRSSSRSKSAAPKKFDITQLDSLIMDQTVKDEISSVIKQHQNQDVLFTEWGLGEVIEYGRGMTFLFYGGPGTGKTWAAHCIAKVLGTELLIMSAAEIQSSEPGAANRNIQQAFKTAQEEGKVLFLDECDSLITSRAELGMVLAGEVNTLLTEIEKSEGVVILATNRIESMDEALERRISLIAEFPAPDKDQRVDIWKKMLPKKMPVAEDVTPEELSKYRLTGGQIKNAVLAAARLALAQEKKEVSMAHFVTAIDRILASKNLMGTASRYHQGPVDDFFRSSRGGYKIRDAKIMSLQFEKVENDDIDEDAEIIPTTTPDTK